MDITSHTLNYIVSQAMQNRYIVPDLQRDFRWGRERIRSLLASVIASHPIGSFLLVEAIKISDGEYTSGVNLTRTMSGANLAQTGDPYVLDGQQRLVSLIAGFRTPRQGKVSDWFESRAERIWLLDLDLWMKQLLDGSKANVQDVRPIERSIVSKSPLPRNRPRAGSNGVKLTLNAETKVCMSKAAKKECFRLPLWCLLKQDPKSSSAIARDVERFKDAFFDCYSKDDQLPKAQAIFEQLLKIRTFSIPITRLEECSAIRAAAIFTQINCKGLPLASSDLICSQFVVHDRDLRSSIRELQATCDGRTLPSTALKGIFEEDLLRIAVAVSAGQESISDFDSNRLLRQVERKEGVDAIGNGVNAIRPALKFAAEILGECGISDRESWPIDSLQHSLIAVLARHPSIFTAAKGGGPGPWKYRFIKWWWKENLRQILEVRRPKTSVITADLDRAVNSVDQGFFSPIPTFSEMNLRGALLKDPYSISLSRLVASLLRTLDLPDFHSHSRMNSGYQSLDLHHIFPKAWAKTSGIPDVNCLANLTLMESTTNQNIIRAKSPAVLMEELLDGAEDARPRLSEILKKHGILESAYRANDFKEFLEFRLDWFDERLKRVGDPR
ncbi:MAG: DUF262 domain-containing protein [Planctomycetota bacterium]|nr:DUF262 domain-containing protein [Planctomycetota bacterium]